MKKNYGFSMQKDTAIDETSDRFFKFKSDLKERRAFLRAKIMLSLGLVDVPGYFAIRSQAVARKYRASVSDVSKAMNKYPCIAFEKGFPHKVRKIRAEKNKASDKTVCT